MKGWLATLRTAVEQGPGAGSTLVVATSGGGDSVALLRGLYCLQEALNLRLVVAHLDHRLREESGEDAAFVGQLALDLGLLCLREGRNVAAMAEREKLNLEAAARRARFGFLEEVGKATKADAIVTAHTADDQAETVLMQLLRGAGLDGLKGMTMVGRSPLPGATVPLFRPLLLLERQTLREWLREQGVAWREDATNEDTARFRNQLRHQTLPFLEGTTRPGVRERLARTANVLAEDHAWIESATEQSWNSLATVGSAHVRLERGPFLEQPAALQRRLVRRAFFQLRPHARDLSFEQVNEALEVARRGDNGMRATLPGGLFLFVGNQALMIGAAWDVSDRPRLSEPVVLPQGGTVEAEGLTVTVREVTPADVPSVWDDVPATVAYLDSEKLQSPLVLRHIEEGERWAPLGMNGQTVELREWMAKRKVPLTERDRMVVLADAEGTVLWVVGVQMGDAAHIGPSTQRMVVVSVAHRMLETKELPEEEP